MTDGDSTDDGFMSAEELRRFCEYFYSRTGISYGDGKKLYIERRVAERMHSIGAKNFATYMRLLRTHPYEVEQLINAFTVNETYYYREDAHLRCLSDALLPDIIRFRAPGELIRIWSIPCSTGEEPYSIAIWLLENWRLVDAYNIEILASDIDTRVLEQAADGIYGTRALSRLPTNVLTQYFTNIQPGKWQVIRDLRESVKFTQANLIDGSSMRAHGTFDIIFCRNVLIYFDDASRHVASVNLYNCLNPKGYICLGHSESMARISDRFTSRRFTDGLVHQRPEL